MDVELTHSRTQVRNDPQFRLFYHPVRRRVNNGVTLSGLRRAARSASVRMDRQNLSAARKSKHKRRGTELRTGVVARNFEDAATRSAPLEPTC